MSDQWKRGIYRDVRFFHGAIQLWNLINSCCWNTWKSATYSVLIEACVGTLSIKMTRTSDSSFLQWTELTTAGHHGHRLYLAHTRSPACQSNMQTVYMQLHTACTQQCNFSDKLDRWCVIVCSRSWAGQSILSQTSPQLGSPHYLNPPKRDNIVWLLFLNWIIFLKITPGWARSLSNVQI